MKTKQKTITSTWRTIAFVERESWKHNRFNTGGITDEMAVKTKPPSDVKDPSISSNLISSKDIEENNITKERTEPGDHRDHRRLQKPVDESSGISNKQSRGFLVPNCFLQNLVQRRRVDGIGE